MDFQDAQGMALRAFHELNTQFHKIPGSAVILRYIRSSYQVTVDEMKLREVKLTCVERMIP